jgi:hypothetical protein
MFKTGESKFRANHQLIEIYKFSKEVTNEESKHFSIDIIYV